MRMRDVIICMIFLVLAVAAGLTAFNEWGEADQPDYEYLDMVPLSTFGDPDAVSGCCEVVTYLGEPYVRMTDVGEIHVVKGSEVTSYTVGKAQLDLFLYTGQSNSQFYTDPDYYPYQSPLRPGTAFFLGTETVTASDNYKEDSMMARPSTLDVSDLIDFTAPDGTVRLSQIYPTFLYDYCEATCHKALVVNSGYGGRGIGSWASLDGLASLWTIDVLGRTLELADGKADLEPIGVLFSQGESDADQTADYYERYLAQAVGHFCDGDYGIAFPKVFSVLPTHYRYQAPTNPAIAQQSYASQDSRFVVACTLPAVLPTSVLERPDDSDRIHYNQTVYNWIGEAFARTVAADAGYEPARETLVYIADLGEVDELPETVTALGTSGEGVAVSVSWTGAGADPGTYEAIGTPAVPFGYEAAAGLTARATLVVPAASEEENSD